MIEGSTIGGGIDKLCLVIKGVNRLKQPVLDYLTAITVNRFENVRTSALFMYSR